jgi:hypothetical protein
MDASAFLLLFSSPMVAIEEQIGYRAEQAADGTWSIYDVPVFAAHVDDRGSEEILFSAAWLNRALRKALTRQSEGYLPPLHVHHHGDPRGVEGAGKFRLTKVAPYSHGGEEISTLFADLVGVRPSTYDRIRKGELSYRSVEILDYEVPEIDSLALLDDEVPYFRFGLLRITEELPATKKSKRGIVKHYRAKNHARGMIFQFNAPKTLAAAPQENEMKPEDDEEVQKGADEMPAWAAEIVGLLKKALGMDEEDKEEEEEEQAPPVQAAASPVEVGMPQSNDFAALGAQASQNAQIAQLTEKLERLEMDRRVEKYASGLTQRGYSAEIIDQYRSVAGKHGEQAAKQFAAGVELNGPAEPPRTWSGEITPRDEPDSAAVQFYASKGPEQLERARSIAKSHARTGSGLPLDKYIAVNMDPNNFLLGGN